jgi:uncharacterized damage-inducible protein DinB
MATRVNTKKKKTAPKKKAAAKKETKPQFPVAIKKEVIAELDPNIYPIGKHKAPEVFTDAVITKLIQDIRVLPEHLKAVSKKINKKKKLQYTYREGGWNIEQMIHHIADSHLNAFIRFKLALTENNPTIKPYDENLWAETADIQLPIKNSIRLLKAIHAKWTVLLENMDANDWKRTYFHPEYKKSFMLKEILPLYAWHGKHHVAQIEVALKNG